MGESKFGFRMRSVARAMAGRFLLGISLILSMLAPMSVSHVLAAPTATLAQMSGPVGSAITIQISGWQPDMEFWLIWFSGEDLDPNQIIYSQAYDIRADGTVKIDSAVPSNAAVGNHRISFRYPASASPGPGHFIFTVTDPHPSSPGGLWVTPFDHDSFSIYSSIRFAAHAYGGGGVKFVSFTGLIDGTWSEFCRADTPLYDDVYACEYHFNKTNPKDNVTTPKDIAISFDVYANHGTNFAPNGVHTVHYDTYSFQLDRTVYRQGDWANLCIRGYYKAIVDLSYQSVDLKFGQHIWNPPGPGLKGTECRSFQIVGPTGTSKVRLQTSLSTLAVEQTFQVVASSSTKATTPGRLAVPFVSQYPYGSTRTLDCGAASAASILYYYFNGGAIASGKQSVYEYLTEIRGHAVSDDRKSSTANVDLWFQDLAGDETYIGPHEGIFRHYGLTPQLLPRPADNDPNAAAVINQDIQQMKQAIAAGNPIIALVHGATLGRGDPYGDHFVVVTGFSDDGKAVWVNDVDDQFQDPTGWSFGGAQVVLSIDLFRQAITKHTSGNAGGSLAVIVKK